MLLTTTTLAPSSLFQEFELFCEPQLPPLLELFQVTCSWHFLFILHEFPASALQPPFSAFGPREKASIREEREFFRHDERRIERVLKPRGRRRRRKRRTSLWTWRRQCV